MKAIFIFDILETALSHDKIDLTFYHHYAEKSQHVMEVREFLESPLCYCKVIGFGFFEGRYYFKLLTDISKETFDETYWGEFDE